MGERTRRGRKQRGTARAICADRGSSGGGASHSVVSGHPRCRDAQSGVELGNRRQLGRRRAARHLGGGLGRLPDSPAALRALSQQYKLVILSNVDRVSFAKSNERLGVEFDAIITAQDVGSYKPTLNNFVVLVERVRVMGVEDGRLLHVAQSLFHDHVPARSLGLPTVWIDRRGARHGWGATPPPPTAPTPDWTFPSMAVFAAACHSERNE